MRILVTGSRGHIGRLICPHLEAAGLAVRGFDRRAGRGGLRDEVRGDLNDPPALRRALRGCDAVIHLAACADDADFIPRLLPANVAGVHRLLEAAGRAGVRRVVFASSVQVVAGLIGRREVTADDRAPANRYALSKLWGEELGRLAAQAHDFSFLAARLGWVLRNARERAEMKRMAGGRRWVLDADDARDFFLRSVTADFAGSATVYAVSRTGAGWFDLEPARRLLGFVPGRRGGSHRRGRNRKLA